MAICLNTKAAYKDFNMLVNDYYFVDKSDIIETINTRIKTKNRYLCITKPRSFGKASVLNMLGAYYCKAYDSRLLFEGLKISRTETCTTHLNQYNVIHLSLNEIPLDRSRYEDYIAQINNAMISDIKEAYPTLQDKEFEKASDALAATDDEFVFIIDEWDYVFSHELYSEHHGDFLEFLRNLLKDPFFDEYFGFTEREEKSGKGFADFLFYPRRKNLPGIIIELKANDTPAAAIAQIKEKEYIEKLKKEKIPAILLVGISYNSSKTEHQCIIEELI